MLLYENGELYWKARHPDLFKTRRACLTWNRRFAGEMAGGHRPDGYRSLSIHGVAYMGHRVVWMLRYGSWPIRNLKFADDDRSNIGVSNLRLAGCAKDPIGHKGVQFDRGRWRARAGLGGCQMSVGTYATADEAAVALDKFNEGKN